MSRFSAFGQLGELAGMATMDIKKEIDDTTAGMVTDELVANHHFWALRTVRGQAEAMDRYQVKRKLDLRSAEINEHFKVDAYSTELSTEPIRLRRIELGVLIPRYITAEEEEEEEEEYYQTHRGPFWSVTADDGSVCIESRKLSDLVLWLAKFSEKFDEAVVELEAAK